MSKFSVYAYNRKKEKHPGNCSQHNIIFLNVLPQKARSEDSKNTIYGVIRKSELRLKDFGVGTFEGTVRGEMSKFVKIYY